MRIGRYAPGIFPRAKKACFSSFVFIHRCDSFFFLVAFLQNRLERFFFLFLKFARNSGLFICVVMENNFFPDFLTRKNPLIRDQKSVFGFSPKNAP